MKYATNVLNVIDRVPRSQAAGGFPHAGWKWRTDSHFRGFGNQRVGRWPVGRRNCFQLAGAAAGIAFELSSETPKEPQASESNAVGRERASLPSAPDRSNLDLETLVPWGTAQVIGHLPVRIAPLKNKPGNLANNGDLPPGDFVLFAKSRGADAFLCDEPGEAGR